MDLQSNPFKVELAIKQLPLKRQEIFITYPFKVKIVIEQLPLKREKIHIITITDNKIGEEDKILITGKINEEATIYIERDLDSEIRILIKKNSSKKELAKIFTFTKIREKAV